MAGWTKRSNLVRTEEESRHRLLSCTGWRIIARIQLS
jgi:hypothetical protein